MIVIEDEQPARSQQTQTDDYEEEEDELDPDSPYPNIIQDVALDLGTEVLQLAVPSLPTSSSSRTRDTLRSHGLMAVACADGTHKVLQFPLAPPSDVDKQTFANNAIKTQARFPSSGSVCHAITSKIIATEALIDTQDSQASSFLLVAAVSDKLHIHRISIFQEPTTLSQDAESRTITLPHLATGVSFHPSPRSTQLLIADVSGAVRVYDPYASSSSSARPSSASSALDASDSDVRLGKWIVAFHTSFASGKTGLARRKHVLDARWAMNGKAVLSVLEDGEWGMWDASGTSQPGKNVESFVINGFLSPSAASDSAEPAKQRRGVSKLAPMTPNTRKAKAEVLFSGTPKISGVAARGGISVSSSSSRTGQTDDTVLMWYHRDIYSIPSLQAFWQRSTNNSGGFGSLYSPGLSHVSDINLMNEAITSIAQFAASATTNSFGQMNTQRDLLISAEHRFIILQSLKPPTPAKALFQQAAAGQPTSRDQRMIDAGELDIGGVDRILDSMANGDGRPRRVGFAH